VLVIAIVGVFAASAMFSRPRMLSSTHPADVSQLSVIIPARNEALSLPRLLATLQGAGCLEVIVVDDSSIDETASIASIWGARVIPAGPLPAGWAGKPWACHVGAAAARGSVLVFLDADTRLAPGALGHVVAAQRDCGGLVSVQPFHRVPHLYEQLSALFNAAAVLGSGQFTFRRYRGGTRGRAVAFGPCMVTSYADYEAVGGHARVRTCVVEDIALAQCYRAAGLATECLLGGGLVQFRMYPDGIRSLVEGWTKNIALGAGQASPVAVGATVVWIAALASVALSTVAGWVGWAAHGGVPVAASIAWVVMSIHLGLLLKRLGSFRWLTFVIFPVPLLVFVTVFARSSLLVLFKRPVRWRGRMIGTQARGT